MKNYEYREYLKKQIKDKRNRNILDKNKEKFLELKLIENNNNGFYYNFNNRNQKKDINKFKNKNNFNNLNKNNEKNMNRMANCAKYILDNENLNILLKTINKLNNEKKDLKNKFKNTKYNLKEQLNKNKYEKKIIEKEKLKNNNENNLIKDYENKLSDNLNEFKNKVTNKYLNFINKRLDTKFRDLKNEIENDTSRFHNELNLIKNSSENLKLYKNKINDELDLFQKDILYKQIKDDENLRNFYRALELTNEDNYVSNNNINKVNNINNNHYCWKKNNYKPLISENRKRDFNKYEIISIKNQQRNNYLNKIHNLDKLSTDRQINIINDFIEKEELNNKYMGKYL